MKLSKIWFAAPLLAINPVVANGQDQQPVAQQAQDEARIAAVQRHVDAYRSGNLDQFVATFTPDAEVYANGMVARGQNEIRELYRLNFQPGAPKIRIHDSGIAGNFVYLSVGYVTSDGQEICCSYSEYEVRDGKISYLAASG